MGVGRSPPATLALARNTQRATTAARSWHSIIDSKLARVDRVPCASPAVVTRCGLKSRRILGPRRLCGAAAVWFPSSLWRVRQRLHLLPSTQHLKGRAAARTARGSNTFPLGLSTTAPMSDGTQILSPRTLPSPVLAWGMTADWSQRVDTCLGFVHK